MSFYLVVYTAAHLIGAVMHSLNRPIAVSR